MFSMITQCYIIDSDVAVGCAMEGDIGICQNFGYMFCTGSAERNGQVRKTQLVVLSRLRPGSSAISLVEPGRHVTLSLCSPKHFVFL